MNANPFIESPATEPMTGIDLDEMIHRYGAKRVERGLSRMMEDIKAARAEDPTKTSERLMHNMDEPE